MTRFHAVTWQEGSFDRTASVLSFDSKAAREAYRINCPQRYEFINYTRKQALLRDGRMQRLVLWAGVNNPNKFTFKIRTHA